MSGSRRTRPRRRLSNSRSAPPSVEVQGEAVPLGLDRRPLRAGADVVAALVDAPVALGDEDPAAHAQVDAEDRGRRTSRTHIDLPRRWAATSRRPSRAARISPGACGRQTQVSVSSTSSIRRPSAERSITARADSTSGSSGTRSVLRPGPTGPHWPNLSWAAFSAGHSPCGAAARGQVAQPAGPGAAVLAADDARPSPSPAARAGRSTSAGSRAPTNPERYADRAPPTARARSRPASVSRTARLRPSGPADRVTRPARLEPVDEPDRPRRRQAQHLVDPVDRGAVEELGQRRQGRGVGHRPDVVGHRPAELVGDDERERAEHVGQGALRRPRRSAELVARSPGACSGSRPGWSCSTRCR